MLEYFVESGREEDWVKPPVKGELLFGVEKNSNYETTGLEYIWRLMVVNDSIGNGTLVELKGLLISNSLKNGIFSTRPNYERISELGDVFGNRDTDVYRSKYFRASEFEVCQFFVAARVFFNLPKQKEKNDPVRGFNAFANQVLVNDNYLPKTERTVDRAYNWALRVNLDVILNNDKQSFRN
ncbi:MAG: hypothetical protein KIH89_003640 [Candidatus Shapirobacteria bacterium]|nr:hypothetical protein [Candidatus Shapirobacteria bacterium]